MKIILDGIDGTGKTTILNSLAQVLEERHCHFRIINEIQNSPISEILSQMLKEDPFFRVNNNGNLLPYATLLLLADHQYKQNAVNIDDDVINIFDRDYPTLIVYQQRLLKDFYNDKNLLPFLNAIEECASFNIKPADLLVYVSVPLEISVQRVRARSRRENEQFEKGEIAFLQNVKNDFEKSFLLLEEKKGTNILRVDGTMLPFDNANLIADKIVQIYNTRGVGYEKN